MVTGVMGVGLTGTGVPGVDPLPPAPTGVVTGGGEEALPDPVPPPAWPLP